MLATLLAFAAMAHGFERCVVTGAGSGIGRAVAEALCSRGLPVVGVGRTASTLEDTAARCGGRFEAVVADVATPDGRAAVAARAVDPRRTLLVHNAARTGELATIDALTLDDWRQTMATNVLDTVPKPLHV